MYRILIILLLVSKSLNAQIGYGRPHFILEQQWETLRKEHKVKTMHRYMADDSVYVKDSAYAYYLNSYNKYGQLEVLVKFTKDSTDRIMYIRMIDSISYTDNGIFNEKRKFLPTDDGDFRLSYRAKAHHNINGLIDTLFIYGKDNKLSTIRVYRYTDEDRIDSTSTYNYITKKLEQVHSFKYTEKGNLVVRNINANTSFSFTLLTYTKNNLLESYFETYANGREAGTTKYTYDTAHRLLKQGNTSDNYYYSNYYWFYEDGEKLPKRLNTEAPKSEDDKSLKYHYETYTYEYFE